MAQELESYIYILDKQEGSTYNIISFEPTLCAARKTMAKLVKCAKYALETEGSKVYTTKTPNDNSVSLFQPTVAHIYTSKPGQEKTFSIKRIPSHPSENIL